MALLSTVIQYGTRGSQPSAASVGAGTLYCVSDESGIIERSSGAAWQSVGGSAGSASNILIGTLAITNAMFDAGLTPVDIIAAPGANKVIIPVSIILYCNVSVGKGANPTQRIRYTGDSTPVADYAVGGSSINLPLNTTGEAYRVITPNTSSATTPAGPFAWANTTFDPRNKALQWSQSVNTAAGTGTGKVRVAYWVADLT